MIKKILSKIIEINFSLEYKEFSITVIPMCIKKWYGNHYTGLLQLIISIDKQFYFDIELFTILTMNINIGGDK